jgi:hypothetical protein
MHPRLVMAMDDVKATFIDHDVNGTELPDGSVWMAVAGVDFGAGWVPRTGELAVKLAPTFPDTGPYPWYLPESIRRDDGVAVERITPVEVDGVARAQLSLNAPWSPSDSLGARVLGVLRWLRSHGSARAS